MCIPEDLLILMQSIAFIFVGKKNIMGDARMGENLDTLLIIKNVEKSPK